MAGKQSKAEQGNAPQYSFGEHYLLSVLAACGLMSAVSVYVQAAKRSMIRREGGLVQLYKHNNALAGGKPDMVQDVAHGRVAL